MTNPTKAIRVSNGKIWFNDKESIDIINTNIPLEHITLRENNDIYWKVEMLWFKSNRLKVKILDYNYENPTQEDLRTSKHPIEFLEFQGFNWWYFEFFVITYTKGKLDNKVFFNLYAPLPEESIPKKSKENPIKKEFQRQPSQKLIPNANIPTPLLPKGVPENTRRELCKLLMIHIDNCKFEHKLAVFSYFLPEISQTINFQIYNEILRPEFNNIKHAIFKALQKKAIEVELHIIIENNKVIKITATSYDIDSINEEVIARLNINIVQSFTALKRTNTTKTLLNIEDLYIMSDNSNFAEVADLDNINTLIDNSDNAHKEEIKYLASKKHSNKYKILFTIESYFGFIFTVEGTNCNHYAWELLKSHATYIWSFNKENHAALTILEQQIQYILSNGRNVYKKNYNPIDFRFYTIIHEKIASNTFDRWRLEVDTIFSI